MKVAELFEGVDTPRKRPQSMIQYGAKVAAEQMRKLGLKVRIDTRVIGKHEKSNRTVMTVDGDIDEAALLKILKKNEVEYATVGSTTKDGKKSRMIRLVTPKLQEGKDEQLDRVRKDYKNAMLWVNAPKNEVADHERAKWERLAQKLRDHAKTQFKIDLKEGKVPTKTYGPASAKHKYEVEVYDVEKEWGDVVYIRANSDDEVEDFCSDRGWEIHGLSLDEGLKDFGRKVLNKVMGVPDGEHKYKVGDTVKFEMSPGQAGGSGTGKIEKLLKGHHYLINGKPVNQNEIKSKVAVSKDEEPRSSISGDSLRYQEMRRDLPGRFEAVAEPIKKFTKGQKVKVKKTGEEVEVISQNDIGLVFTASKDAVKIPNDKKLKIVPGKGYKEYMPRELQEMRVDELSVDTLASYRSKRLKQRGEVFAADPYATPKGPKDPLGDKVHTGVHRAYRKELHGKSVEANKKDPGRGSIQRQYYSGESGSRSGD